ncbi:hypothetical protein LZ31DRAFT_616784 [Colletotrichum somersetense]|nr:hypothetical protein LZ31DRAFT_616784 [Colletotrichum somersetense]
MPPAVIHTELINRVSKSSETAARPTLPDVRYTAGSSVSIISEAGHKSQFIPDGGWNVNELDHRPRFVLEVAVSQTRDEVAYKLEEYIIASRHVRAAVGVKVYYDPSNPRKYEDILGHLD